MSVSAIPVAGVRPVWLARRWLNLCAGEAFWGDLLALTGAWAVAGYLIIGRRLRKGVSLLSYIFVVYGMAALVLVGVAVLAGLPFFGFSPFTYLMLLGLALIPQLLGHTTYNYALAYLSAAFVSVAALGEPVGSSILAYFLLDEIPERIKAGGRGADPGGHSHRVAQPGASGDQRSIEGIYFLPNAYDRRQYRNPSR